MKAEINRTFEYSYSIVKNEGSMSTFVERNINTVTDAILSLEKHREPTIANYQIIVEYGELVNK